MKETPRVFLDSDVVISSLLSSQGAARILIESGAVERWLSSHSQRELETVATRMGIQKAALDETVRRCGVAALTEPERALAQKFALYVSDEKDAHIVAGAFQCQARFLLTYNMRHYCHDRIKTDFDILTMTPGSFLQYLRSLEQ